MGWYVHPPSRYVGEKTVILLTDTLYELSSIRDGVVFLLYLQ
jgi:hypothetical protein